MLYFLSSIIWYRLFYKYIFYSPFLRVVTFYIHTYIYLLNKKYMKQTEVCIQQLPSC